MAMGAEAAEVEINSKHVTCCERMRMWRKPGKRLIGQLEGWWRRYQGSSARRRLQTAYAVGVCDSGAKAGGTGDGSAGWGQYPGSSSRRRFESGHYVFSALTSRMLIVLLVLFRVCCLRSLFLVPCWCE